MAQQVYDLPCDGEGICMACKNKPTAEESVTCKTCATPWHVTCLSVRPSSLADTLQWDCPDCSLLSATPVPVSDAGESSSSGGLIAAICAIESDSSLTDREKAKRRQQLLCKDAGPSDHKEVTNGDNNLFSILDGLLNCSFCMQLLERPVSTPCGHNFCLKCFTKWIGRGKRNCANCRKQIPPKMARLPLINSTLVTVIRMAKMAKANAAVGPSRDYPVIRNEDRPDKAFSTERSVKSGNANAASGKIFVTTPMDHFGPILPENDPKRNQGVLVGETWASRLECRQWGVHNPHISGIAGQSKHGAQSVTLSGGYEDDEDHGEWFLYTGSGGRDLSGNKRTNKEHSFDQQFENSNEALRLSCRMGYPVRVVRSHKEKRSSYAPKDRLRYDGIYRVEKCWRKTGIKGFKVCRYLFVRCDNDPAPWTSDVHGDRPRPLPVIEELNVAIDITERKGSPSWDYDEEKVCWMWKKPPPCSRKRANNGHSEEGKRTKKVKRQAQNKSVKEKLLKECSCYICKKVMTSPLTTPCAHNFCKSCLESAFDGQSFVRQRTCEGRRTLRAQKNIMKCPSCSNDIAEFLQNPQVNRELMEVIESLQREIAKENKESKEETDGIHENPKGVDVSNEIVEEAKENNLKGQIESEIQLTEKMKETSCKCTQKRGKKKGSTSCKRLDDGKNGVDPLEPEKAASEELQDPIAESKV
ncbi:E3 ubiquitin-protein ligase ORTHRUS 2-like [Quercus lobata]|uniref:E3 ubiquitin-protein ligase ORTHRUS 2-like n=1 Tax=Quercus lobata TaxID=97700 RepID=UPI001247F68E|nr:E3 ubiquitin-protein ligase ORTHRUS 2-like [Quercus lobata]